MLNEDEKYELEESLEGIADYYSTITGRNIQLGVDGDDDIWLDSSRTNGKEYYDSIETIEDRLRVLYSDLMVDDDYEVEDF